MIEFCTLHNKWHAKGPTCGAVAVNVKRSIFEAALAYALADIEATDREAARTGTTSSSGAGAAPYRRAAEQHRQRLLEAVRQSYGRTTINPVA